MSETNNNYKDDMCSICRDNYKDTDNIEKLPCGHCFHDTCITIFNKNNKCPLCRKIIDDTISTNGEEGEEVEPEDPRESSSFKNLPVWKKERCGYIPNQTKRKEILAIQKKNEEHYKSLMARRPEGGSGVLGTNVTNSGDYDLNDPKDLRKLRLNRIRADKSKVKEQRIVAKEKVRIAEETPILEKKKNSRLISIKNKKNIQESSKKAREDSRKRHSSEKETVEETLPKSTNKPSLLNKKILSLLSDLNKDTLKKVIDRMAETPGLSLEVAISEESLEQEQKTDREKRLDWLNRLQNNTK